MNNYKFHLISTYNLPITHKMLKSFFFLNGKNSIGKLINSIFNI